MSEAKGLLPLLYEDVVRRALAEDLGRAGDVTTDAIVPADLLGRAAVVARAAGRVAGLEPALHAFRLLDTGCRAEVRLPDGSDAAAGQVIARVSARARALLTGERTALNLLGRLSGIATATRDVVARLEGLKTRVVSTRKTTPGLRALEKYAVRVGGGGSHRYGLDDAVLLDNLDLKTLREAVQRARGRALTEASGGVRADNVRAIAETGVDLVSIGWLTHSAPALDIALDVEP